MPYLGAAAVVTVVVIAAVGVGVFIIAVAIIGVAVTGVVRAAVRRLRLRRGSGSGRLRRRGRRHIVRRNFNRRGVGQGNFIKISGGRHIRTRRGYRRHFRCGRARRVWVRAGVVAVISGTAGRFRPRRLFERLVYPAADFLRVITAHGRIADFCHLGEQGLFYQSFLFRGGAVFVLGVFAPQNIYQRRSLVHQRGETVAPVRLQILVGILIIRQKQEFQRIAGFEHRQNPVNGAHGRFYARRIAIQTQSRLRADAPGFGYLLFGQRGAERRHGVAETVTVKRNHVHIAFADYQLFFFVSGFARLVQIV